MAKDRGRTQAAEADPASESGSFSPRSSGWKSVGPLKEPRRGRPKGASTGRARALARPAPSGHQLIPVTCSECFEELSFDTGVASETLTCPLCEHSAARPDDATLAQVDGALRAERTNALVALGLAAGAAAGPALWLVVQANPHNAQDAALFFGPLGLGGLCALALAAFLFRYERNRCEVYF